MFLGDDTVTVLAGGEEIKVNGCRLDGNRGLIPYPLEGQQVLLVLGDGTRHVATDVVTWYDAAGNFDHAEGTFKAVTDDGAGPDRDQ